MMKAIPNGKQNTIHVIANATSSFITSMVAKKAVTIADKIVNTAHIINNVLILNSWII